MIALFSPAMWKTVAKGG